MQVDRQRMASIKKKLGIASFYWGKIIRLEKKKNYRVSRVEILPGQETPGGCINNEGTRRISVVQGKGIVCIAGKEHSMSVGSSCAILKGWPFQISNEGPENLIIIDILSASFSSDSKNNE